MASRLKKFHFRTEGGEGTNGLTVNSEIKAATKEEAIKRMKRILWKLGRPRVGEGMKFLSCWLKV